MQENIFEQSLLLSHLFTTDEGLENNHSNNDRLNVLKDHKISSKDTKLYFLSLTSNNGSVPINVIQSNLIKPLSLLMGNLLEHRINDSNYNSKSYKDTQ